MADPDSRLRVSVVDALGRPVRSGALAAWLARVAPRRARGTVTIALVPDSRVQALNKQYRKKDRVTDVLAFSSGPGSRVRRPRSRGDGPDLGPWTSDLGPDFGDIVIARGRAARQARAEGHPLQTELRILALHGLLHLLGYDHERDHGEMRRVEARLRRRGGLGVGLIERTR